MNKEKVIELAKEAGFAHSWAEFAVDALARFAALIEREVHGDAEPVAWIRKTDITEMTDTEPETDGWMPLYTHPAYDVVSKLQTQVSMWKKMSENLQALIEAKDRREDRVDRLLTSEMRGDVKPVAWTTLEELQDLQNYTHSNMWGEKVWPDEVDYIPLYTHPAPAVVRQLVNVLSIAEDYIVEALSSHDASYDHHPAMKADRDLIVQDIHQLKSALNAAVRWEMKTDDEKELPKISGCGDGWDIVKPFHPNPTPAVVQEPVFNDIDEALEKAYWQFDAMVKGYGKWKLRRQSERDAFKQAVRSIGAFSYVDPETLHESEEYECVSLALNDRGVPDKDENGNKYSLWGRVELYASPALRQPANVNTVIVHSHPAPAVDAEPNWKHSKIQALIASDARNRIVIDLIWQLIDNPECELTSMDMEYWDLIHETLKNKLSQAALDANRCEEGGL